MRSVVQVHLGPPIRYDDGGVAQLGERLPCTQEVIGSNPFTSTIVFFLVLVLVSVSGIEY